MKLLVLYAALATISFFSKSAISSSTESILSGNSSKPEDATPSSLSAAAELQVVLPEEYVVQKAIRFSVLGRFGSQMTVFESAVVSGLLRYPDLVPLPLEINTTTAVAYSESVYHHQLLPESTLVLLSNNLLSSHEKGHKQPYSDACLLFLDDKLMLDEDLVLGRFLDSFRALLHNRNPAPASGNSTGPAAPAVRPSLLVLFSGQVSDQVEVLLSQAWRLRSRVLSHRPLSPQPLRELDVQIILLPAEEEGQGDRQEGEEGPVRVALGSAAVAVVDKLLDTLQQRSSLRPMELALGAPVGATAEGEGSATTTAAAAAAASVGLGMQLSDRGRIVAMNWALSAANDSAGRLGSAKTGPLFGRLVDELQLQARQQLHTFVEQSGQGVHPASLAASERALHDAVFSTMLPLYRRQLQLLRASVAAEINRELTGEDPDDQAEIGQERGLSKVWEDLGLGLEEEGVEVDAFVMQRLRDLSKRALTCFRRRAALLLPGKVRSAPQPPSFGWSCATEARELSTALQTLLDEREAHYRRLGILPREEKKLPPVALSMHLLQRMTGLRDYRQDPLGMQGDLPCAAASLEPSPLVRPSAARKRLLQRLQAQAAGTGSGAGSSGLTPSQAKLLSRQSEFSREMLMFPLSVKNPAVPMAARATAGRLTRPKTLPDPDLRQRTGPERYVRWDIEPMDEVRAALNSLTSISRTSPVDELLSRVPFLAKGWYRSPAVSYGPAYSPSKR